MEEEEEDLFLEQLITNEKKAKSLFNQWSNRPDDYFSESSKSTDYSSSSSSSSFSDEEEEEEEFSRAFYEYLALNATISPYELQNLLITKPATRKQQKKKKQSKREAFRGLDDFLERYEEKRELCKPRMIANEENTIHDEERKRVKYTISNIKDVELKVVIENYVYVTYFRNKYTKQDYLINLNELAIALLRYGIQYSDNKFTKVTIKYKDAASHYFFRSGAMVESGPYNPVIARKTHNMSIALLKKECGFDNLEIRERKCQNIVAKGTLNFGIRLLLLKQQNDLYVQYDEETFHGAIIRLKKVIADRHMMNDNNKKKRASHQPKNKTNKKKRLNASFHTAAIATATTTSSSSSCSSKSSSSSSSSSGEYEYLCNQDDDSRYNENFEKFEVDKEELKAAQARAEAHSIYKVVQKKPLKKKDLLEMHQGPYDLNHYEREALMKKKNVTILVFEKGRFICAGARKTRNVLKAVAMALPMLANARDTPKNRVLETVNAEQVK